MQAPWPSTQYSLPVQRPRPTSDLRPHTAHASPAPSLFGNLQQVPAQDTTPRASMAQLTPYLHAPDRRLSRDDTAADISELLPSAHEDEASFAERHSPIAPDDVSQTWFDDVNFREFVQRQRRPSMLRLPSNLTSVSAESSTSSAARSSTSLGRKFSKTTRDKFTGLRENVSRNVGRIRRSSTSHIADSASSSTRHPMAPASPTSPSKRNGQFDGDRPSKLRQFQKFNDRKDTPAPPAFAMARPGSHNAAQDVLLTMAGGEAARNSAAAFRYAPSVHSQTSRDMREDLNARRSRLGSLSSAADSGADLNSPCPSHYSYKDSDGDVDMMSLEESQMDPLKLLPSEVCLQIFELLDAPDLARVELVSSSWREVAHKSSVWRTAFLRKYQRQIHTTPAPIQVGGAGCGRPNRPNQEWKRMYKARNELEANWRKGAKGAGKAIYLAGHTDSVYCLQFDEEKIITGSRDRTIRVWDINNYTCQRVIGGPNVKPVMGPKVLRTVDYPDFHLATASVNGTAYGNTIYHQPSQWHDASILCLQYDNEILVTGSSDSDLLIWDIKTYEPIKRLSRHTGGVLDVALDAKYIVSCSKDSRIIVWDRKTYEPIGELTGHRGPVNAVQLRGKLLVSASGDGIARLWDLEQMKLVKEFSAKERGLAAVEFSEDMQYVLAGGNDTITYKFETETGKEVKQFTGHNQLVRSLWLDSQNNRVVSGSYDLDLRVYDFETGDEIFRAEEWTTSWMLAAKSDYRRIVATSQDGRILVIDFGLNKCNDPDDGQPIDGLDLLRGIDNTNAIQWRDPWERARQQERERERARARLLQQAQQQPLFS